LDEGIYAVFDTCGDQEFALMRTVFDNAEREHFRQLWTHYEKHRKFNSSTS